MRLFQCLVERGVGLVQAAAWPDRLGPDVRVRICDGSLRSVPRTSITWSVSSFVGIPWKEGGRDLDTGIDCLGLILRLHELRSGALMADPWEDAAEFIEGGIPDTIVPAGWRQVALAEIEPWDVLHTGPKAGQHLSLVGDHGHALSTDRQQGSHTQPVRDLLRVARDAWRYVG